MGIACKCLLALEKNTCSFDLRGEKADHAATAKEAAPALVVSIHIHGAEVVEVVVGLLRVPLALL